MRRAEYKARVGAGARLFGARWPSSEFDVYPKRRGFEAGGWTGS